MTRGERTKPDRPTVSRRRLLHLLLAAGLPGVVGSASGRRETESSAGDDASGSPPTEYRLGAQVSGWVGRRPAGIEDTENPTLHLRAGRTYTIAWVNLDGQDHQLQIVDGDDESIAESDVVGTQGATGAVEFEASPRTVSYRCSIHTSSMTGRIRVERGVATTRRRDAEPATRTTDAAEPARTTSADRTGPGSTVSREGPTEADAGTADGAPDGDGQNAADGTAETVSDGQPGLGVLAGLAALGGAAGLARRRSDD